SEIYTSINENLSKDFAILSDRVEIFEELKSLDDGVFEAENSLDFIALAKKFKLASLEYEKYSQILKNFDTFLDESAKNALNPFDLRILNLEQDLLNLSKFSSFLSSKDLKFDTNLALAYVKFDEKIYYLKSLKIKDENKVLPFYEKLKDLAFAKKAKLAVHSGALYSLNGGKTGNQESIFMSLGSLLLLGFFVFFAFGKWQILASLNVVLFAFLCGLCGGFVFFENIHILSVVVSTSLAGLVLDFAMHWLGENHAKRIQKDSIRAMKRVFLLALLISSSGYAIFLLAFMPLLSQIAIISIFTLLGAFLATYFLLPELINGQFFKAKKSFKIFIFYVLKALKFLAKRQKFVFIFAFCVIIFAGFRLVKSDFSDNIKNYMSQPKELLAMSADFMKISGFKDFNQIMLLPNSSILGERTLINELRKNAMISDYNGISKFFLDLNEQENLKNFILANMDKIYTHFNFLDKEDILKSLQNLNTFDVAKQGEIPFFGNKFKANDKNIVFVQNASKNDKFFEILAKNDAKFIDILSSINQNFTDTKIKAIYLKILSYIVAFVILAYFLGKKRAGIFIMCLFFASLFSLSILTILGVELNIFCIFGLILANAVGMDYFIIATNLNISRYRRILGILLALITSLISFSLLCFSSILAVASFGLSVCICMASTAIIAMQIALKEQVLVK
ncbi:MAG: hypothetical protein K5978_01190, partial [Campylobacter sp.]|nr:hypothetical protein [Campylobacter sp.]